MNSDNPNIEIVTRAWGFLKAGELFSFLDLLDEHVSWQIPEMPAVPFAGSWQGREAVLKFFEIVGNSQESIEFEPEEFISDGYNVVVLGRFANRVKSTGLIARSAWAQVWTLKDGKVIALREFVDTRAVSLAYAEHQEAEE
jgi:uncharacterized protein